MSKPKPIVIGPKFRSQSGKVSDKEHKLLQMKHHLARLEKLGQDGEINEALIALETVAMTAGAKHEGISDEELRRTWPRSFGDEAVSIPFVVLMKLALGWKDYVDAGAGRTFGEVMGLEGGGQGKQPQKSKLEKVFRDAERVNSVMNEKLQADKSGHPISDREAIERASQKLGQPSDTIEKAWKNDDWLRKMITE